MGWGSGNLGGGSGGLNFKIVGGTSEPSNPKENTIWVNTDTDITSWIFDVDEPAEPVDGMVWITVGTSRVVAFNALKKNAIQVYPISVKQYVGGAWVDKVAKSYQNGGWVDWIPPDIYLVKNGKLKTTLKTYSSSGASMTSAEHTGGYVVLHGSIDGYHAWYDAVDLTAYKSLSVTTTASSSSQKINTLCVWPLTQSEPTYTNASAKVRLQESGTSTVDVSSFKGDYFVGVTSTTTLKVKIVNWWIGQ